MELAYRKLDDAEAQSALGMLQAWSILEGKLTKAFDFKTYKDGIVFASAVGSVADKLNHHPDIHVGYCKVSVSVNTHDVGGLSPYDFELARRIDALQA
jgi:4a-hydroxytetrahydrobiopterin dehydratase